MRGIWSTDRSYYDCRKRNQIIDVEQLTLRRRIKQPSRSMLNAADSGILVGLMRELGHTIGRVKVRLLIKEAALISKQAWLAGAQSI